MSSSIKLKAPKDFEFRVIVCDQDGRVEYDHFSHPSWVKHTAENCLKRLLEKQKEREKSCKG